MSVFYIFSLILIRDPGKRKRSSKLQAPGAAPHLFCSVAVIEELNSAQLEDLVQKGRRLVDVDRDGALAGWIPHSFIKVLQPGGRATKYSHTCCKVEHAQVHTGKSNYLETKDDCWPCS